MRAIRSLRLRFLLTFGLFGGVLTATFGSLAWKSIRVTESVVVERWLAAEAEHYAARRADDPQAPLPSGPIISWVTDPDALPDRLGDRVRELAEGGYELSGHAFEGDRRRWQIHISALPGGQRLYAYVNENAVEASEGHERTASVIRLTLTGLAALLGIGLGLLTTRRIIAPLRRMTEAVSAHEPDRPPPDLQSLVSEDELGGLAEQLEIAMGRVAASARQEQLFGRYASHELRSSLAVASGVTELLEDLGDPRLARPLARLRRSTEDMGGIIETCLWLARSQGQMPPSEQVALRPLAEELLEPLRRRAHAEVELEIEVESDAALPAPRLALRMILTNLLTNALRHTARGRIVLRVDADRVEVCDTGPGIEPDILARITEPYVRGPGEGHGLGLSIVHGLCVRLGWRLEVESAVGEGTTARVLLRPSSGRQGER